MNGFDPTKLRFMAITDRRLASGRLLDTVEAALEGGFTAVQLREKDLPARALYDLAEPLRRMTEARGALFIVNDRLDVALAVGADAAQLGWTSLEIGPARKLAGGRLALGASVHDMAEARRAVRDGADYLILGPLFKTPSKNGLLEPTGVERFREIVAGCPLPVVAVGGIRRDNLHEALAAGAAGVATIRAIMAAGNPLQAARDLVAAAAKTAG